MRPASLILLPLVVLFSMILDISEAEYYNINELHNPKAKKVMIKLQKESDGLDNSLDAYIDKLAANNDLLHALTANRNVYSSAKWRGCAGKEPPRSKNDDIIMSFVNGCQISLYSDELTKIYNKIYASQAKVKEIDNHLHAACTSDPSSCDKEKRKATEQLNGILTTKLHAELKSASAVLEKSKKSLDECFKRDSANLVLDLTKGTEAMKKCLASKS